MVRWGEVVRQMLLKQTSKVTTKTPKVFRVPASLRKASEDAYIPRFVSLGPHHFRKPEAEYQYDDLNNEDYKVKSVATIWQRFTKKKSLTLEDPAKDKEVILDDMVKDIEFMRPQLESFYDWSNTHNDYRHDLGLMMAVDSIFILQFLFGHDGRAHGIQIKCDILKLDNQIPLAVLTLVFDKVKEALLHPHLYAHMCSQDASTIKGLLVQTAYKELSPYNITPDDKQIDDVVQREEPHLLGCLHAIVSGFLPIQPAQDDREPSLRQKISNFLHVRVVEKMCRMLFFSSYKPGDFPIKGYTAEELAKAGIKFKSFSKRSDYIWFDKYSQILYLPRMTVTSPTQTEVFFKNLLALEFNDAARSNEVRHFIQLMDALIDTSRDVGILKRSHVIRLGSALSNDALAKIWHSMHKPFSAGHLEPPEDLKQALDHVLTTKCCIIKCRIALINNFPNIVSFVLQKLGMWPW